MASDSISCQCQVEDRKIPALIIDNICRHLFRPPLRFLSRFVSPGLTAVDLGCGPGYFTLPMAKIVGPGGTVHAVDFDRRAIDRVERKARRQGVSATLAAHAVSASEIDFLETGSVDFLLAEGLLCCMKDHSGAVRQIKRVLKTEGRAYLSIIKFTRKDDPRSVSKSEWTTLLSQMRILDSGEGLMSRWALVSP